ncbi:MAG TPA: hypothetical protein VF244_06630 [Acidimicrobiales bacterium]
MALLGAIFLAAVGIGVVLGDVDRPMQEAASTFVPDTVVTTAPRPTTTVPRATTTTAAPTTTTTAASVPATTVAPRPVTTIAVATTQPPVTEPPTTEPPTTLAPTTTVAPYDAVKCADINSQYLKANAYDDPTRVALLKLNNCPAFYW